MIVFQPASRTDRLTEDGTELTQSPYPFYAEAEDGRGMVGTQPIRVVGFQDRLDRMRIDVHWADVAEDPQRAVGKYIVTEGPDGGWSVHMLAIESVHAV